MADRPTTTRLLDAVEERLPPSAAAVVRGLRGEDLFLLAAGLAFYAIVAVVPFTILVLWLVSLATDKARVHEVANQLSSVLPTNVGIDSALQRVADVGATLGFGAMLGLLWPATAYGSGLRRSFVRLANDNEGREGESKGIRGRALALGLLGVLPALVLAGLVTAYVGSTVAGGGGVARVAGWLLALAFGFLGSAVAVALIYRIFTPCSLGWRGIVRGATSAGGAIALASVGYVIFLNLGADFEHRYATSGLAAVVLLAFWLFIANALILVGFQIAQEA